MGSHFTENVLYSVLRTHRNSPDDATVSGQHSAYPEGGGVATARVFVELIFFSEVLISRWKEMFNQEGNFLPGKKHTIFRETS